MTINKFNYEAFALDYLEGNLSPEMVEEMERFLKTNPAIEAELSGMMDFVQLEPDTSIVFEPKAELLKPEKVVWLSKKWVRPLMAVASVLLLLMTYFLGYQAGTQQHEPLIIAKNTPLQIPNQNGQLSSIEKALPNTSKVEKENELEANSSNEIEQIVQILPELKQMNESKETNESKEKDSADGQVLETLALELVNEPTLLEVIPINQIKQQKMLIVKPLMKDMTLISVAPIASLSANPLDHPNSLEQNLANPLPIDKEWLAKAQKKKRSIKDLFGRIPVSNIKEAFIPTYYKEENAGQ